MESKTQITLIALLVRDAMGVAALTHMDKQFYRHYGLWKSHK